MAGQYLIAQNHMDVPYWWLVIAALLFVGKITLKVTLKSKVTMLYGSG